MHGNERESCSGDDQGGRADMVGGREDRVDTRPAEAQAEQERRHSFPRPEGSGATSGEALLGSADGTSTSRAIVAF